MFVCFLNYKITPSWLGLDVAPEISGSAWCPSFEEDNLVLLKWAREGPRYQGTQRTRSGLPDDRLRWPHHYGNSVPMLVRQEGRGAQILRKTGSHKNWLELAKIKMVLSMVWPLTSNSLHLHYNTKIHSPLTVTGAVIVSRLTIESEAGLASPPSKANKEASLVERNIYFILDASLW